MPNQKILDQIALKGGESLNALVLDKAFTLKTRFGNVKLRKKDIFSIEYAAAASGKDSVRTSDGNVLEGDLALKVLKLHLELGGGSTIEIPKSDIFAVIMLSQRGGDLSAKTSKVLAKLRAA